MLDTVNGQSWLYGNLERLARLLLLPARGKSLEERDQVDALLICQGDPGST